MIFTRVLSSKVPKLCKVRNFSSNSSTSFSNFWNWTTQVRPHWKDSPTEAAVLFTVFGITGSSSVYFVRPLLNNMGIEGSMMEGPNTYRVASLIFVSPVYACILMTLGTISGRHVFFANMAQKILSRFMPKKVSDRLFCSPALKKRVPGTSTTNEKKKVDKYI